MKRNVMMVILEVMLLKVQLQRSMELTDIEIRTSLRAAELVEGDIVGVDLLPAKDREKDTTLFY